VWELVSSLLKDPQRLRAGLEELIEQERAGLRGDPDREAKLWLEKLSELEQERKGYLRLAAKGHMTDDDLSEALSELEDARLTAQTELVALRGRKAAIEALEQDHDTLLESYAAMMPDALDSFAPEARYQIYGMLRLKVEVSGDGTMRAQGVLSERLHMPDGEGEHLCENGVASRCNTQNTELFEFRFHTVLGDGAREVRFEWGDRVSASWKLEFSEARIFQDTFYPSGHPSRFESSAIRIRRRTDAKHPELQFRARLSEGSFEMELCSCSAAKKALELLGSRGTAASSTHSPSGVSPLSNDGYNSTEIAGVRGSGLVRRPAT
jgi:hypothetical protein